jgi:ankyrin repeat protein
MAGVEATAENRLPLVDAVRAGRAETVRALLKQHVDVNASLPDGTTALHWAAQANATELARMLIEAGANANAANRYGVTPLSLAVTGGNATLAEMLLKAGADPNATAGDGETVLMTAAQAGNVATIKALVTHGANVNATEKWQDQTPLMYAAIENHADAVRLLAEVGANVNARSRKLVFPDFVFKTAGMIYVVQPVGSWTALMYAARDGAIDAVRALADMRADLNLVDPDGTTALTLAIVNGHFDTAVALLEKGADPNVADKNNMTPLYAAVDMHTLQTVWGRPAPVLNDKVDPVGMVKALLAHGANPNVQLKRPIIGRHTRNTGDASLSEGSTALARAAKSGDLNIMKVLLEGGANPFLTQKDYTTTVMIAAAGRGQRVYPGAASVSAPATEQDSLEALKLLVQHGVDPDAFNERGQTALHVAAARGADSLVRYLADQGAKLDMKDRRGRTPLDVALGVGNDKSRGPVEAHETTASLLRELMTKRGLTVASAARTAQISGQ